MSRASGRRPGRAAVLAALLAALGIIRPADGAAAPPPRPAPAGPSVEAALLAPTERLRLFALGRVAERTGDPALAALLARDLSLQGFGGEGEAAVAERRLSLAPVLGWDSNLNGGLPNGDLELPGLTLVATPQSRARGGLAGGGRLDGALRVRVAEGAFLHAEGEIEAVHAPREGIGRVTAFGSACARAHLGGWRFADLCRSETAIERDLGRTRAAETSLAGAMLFEAAGGVNEIGLTLARRELSDGVQPAAVASLARVAGRGAGRIAATLGAPVDDALAQRWRLAGELRAAAYGRPFALGLSVEEASGERLFGMDRRDRTRGVSLSLPVPGGASLLVGVAVTDSTVDLFDETRFGLSLRFAPLF